MDSDRLPLLEGPQTVRRCALRKCSSAPHSGGPRERIPGTTDRVDFLWRLSENRLKKSIKTIDSRPQMSGCAKARLGAPRTEKPVSKIQWFFTPDRRRGGIPEWTSGMQSNWKRIADSSSAPFDDSL